MQRNCNLAVFYQGAFVNRCRSFTAVGTLAKLQTSDLSGSGRMPIQGVSAVGAIPPTSKEQAAVPPAAPTIQSPGVDTAEVATTSTLLKSITEAASNVPAIDQARVVELQQAIESGTAKANPPQIAQSFADLKGLLAQAKSG